MPEYPNHDISIISLIRTLIPLEWLRAVFQHRRYENIARFANRPLIVIGTDSPHLVYHADR